MSRAHKRSIAGAVGHPRYGLHRCKTCLVQRGANQQNKPLMIAKSCQRPGSKLEKRVGNERGRRWEITTLILNRSVLCTVDI